MTASPTFIPRSRNWLTRSMSTIALVTTMPMSMSTPMREGTPSGMSAMSCRAIAPVAAKGIDTSSSSG